MPKNDHSDFIAAYTAERGIPKRTAQDRWKKLHPDVLAWMTQAGIRVHDAKRQAKPVEAVALVERIDPTGGSYFASGQASDGQPGEAMKKGPPALEKPESERTMEEHIECEMWQLLMANIKATKVAAKTNDIAAAGFARTAVECMKALQSATQNRVRAAIESGNLLPLAEYESLIREAEKMAMAWVGLGPDLANEFPPQDRARVLRLFEDFTQSRINPIVREMLAA